MGQSQASSPRINIFRPGRFTAVDGTNVEFTEADLQAAADGYDAAGDPAPLVVGHPKLDAPAYGWVKGLSYEAGKLVADVDQLEPAFAEAVRAGRYKKVSASFYPPTHPANPRPGAYSLKHVGFLGGAAPAVKGLGIVHFAEAAEQGLVTVETTQETQMPDTDQTTDFAEREAAIAAREAAADKKMADADAKEKSAEATIRSSLHASNLAFAEQQIAAGKLAPAGKALVVGVMDALEATATADFGEGNGQLTPAAAFRKLFENAGAIVAFGEAAGAQEEEEGKAVSFAAPPGYTADAKALELHGKALALQQGNPNLSYLDAVRQAGG
jgi:hypothetical protein